MEILNTDKTETLTTETLNTNNFIIEEGSIIAEYGEDLTGKKFITDPAIERDEEIKEIILALLTPEKGALLTGLPGVGKTAIVEGLAYRIQNNLVPKALSDHKIIKVNITSLIGSKSDGTTTDSKLELLINELKELDKTILFIDEVHLLIDKNNNVDFANMLKPALDRGAIKMIGATTTFEYETYILRDRAFLRRFIKVDIEEADFDAVLKILIGTYPKLEKQMGVKLKYTDFEKENIFKFLIDMTSEFKRVYEVASRYPDITLTVLSNAFSYAVYNGESEVGINHIHKAIVNAKNIYPDALEKEIMAFEEQFDNLLKEESNWFFFWKGNMEKIIINEIQNETKIKKDNIVNTLNLLKEGATIPFIARYRKEVTGNLNEEQIKLIDEKFNYYKNLGERKETVINLIDERGLLTDKLKREIQAAKKLVDVEDLYLPFKQKRKTKATEAIKMGLEPFAKEIMKFPNKDLNEILSSAEVGYDKAYEHTAFIISEMISDNAKYRRLIRRHIYKEGKLISRVRKTNPDERRIYEIYYDFSSDVKRLKNYQVLAINRAEKEKVLSVTIDFNKDYIIRSIEKDIIKHKNNDLHEYVSAAIKDGLTRLVYPSIIREIRREETDKAEDVSVETFKTNLESLLTERPINKFNVLGFDPAFRTGCKLAALDNKGNLLEISTIFPHPPVNKKDEATKELVRIIEKHNIGLIAIGNGTASRESIEFVSNITKKLENVYYIVVNEAGASVYSASKEAISEFPKLQVEERSAISIGRRVIDPLSELVKIDPKSIGVGEYQHDINNKKLNDGLTFSVEKVVNKVGVNINSASSFILRYVSGVNKSTITKLMNFKKENTFKSREDVKKLMTDRVYEQAIGFIRVNNEEEPLDNTKIHPESYDKTYEILNTLNLNIKDINDKTFKKELEKVNLKELSTKVELDIYTTEDIIEELKNPGLDPRLDAPEVILKSDVLTIDDLTIGMELKGTVRNVSSFGAFIDIGLTNDALVHISKMSKKFVNDPKDIVSPGDIVTTYISELDKEKGRVSLSLIK